MTKQYSEWRENQIKEIGAPLQHYAEEKLDARDHMPMIEMRDEITGKKEKYKKDVADVYEGRDMYTKIGHQSSKSRHCFQVPAIPGFTC